MKKYTLQVRITAVVGLIIILSCLLLTANSLISARAYYGNYVELLEEGQIEYDPALPEGEVPSALRREGGYQEVSLRFSVQSVLSMALIAFLALVITYRAAGRVLRPLKELTHEVREIDDRHLDRRVNPKGAQGEVLELTRSFNRMLERLEGAFLMQKSFASNAAHELKTPLAVMKTSLQVLKMDPEPSEEDYREFLCDTQESLERIIKTVEGLLSLANMEQVECDSAVKLYPLIETAVQELAVRAEEGGVTVSVTGDKGLQVHGSPDLLYRVFFNLIENAVKYNREGGNVDVAVTAKNGSACIVVEDSGIGMEEEVLPHIFEPFFRADSSRSQRIPGSGLGLAVVRLILERHGGEIQVRSRTGGGTAVTITLTGSTV